uniref:Uncharacterized protein n=1 Tax=Onchocerca volvulus TaxID=6282 RepID=A0A8R1TVW3_ONCVO
MSKFCANFTKLSTISREDENNTILAPNPRRFLMPMMVEEKEADFKSNSQFHSDNYSADKSQVYFFSSDNLL